MLERKGAEAIGSVGSITLHGGFFLFGISVNLGWIGSQPIADTFRHAIERVCSARCSSWEILLVFLRAGRTS